MLLYDPCYTTENIFLKQIKFQHFIFGYMHIIIRVTKSVEICRLDILEIRCSNFQTCRSISPKVLKYYVGRCNGEFIFFNFEYILNRNVSDRENLHLFNINPVNPIFHYPISIHHGWVKC